MHTDTTLAKAAASSLEKECQMLLLLPFCMCEQCLKEEISLKRYDYIIIEYLHLVFFDKVLCALETEIL